MELEFWKPIYESTNNTSQKELDELLQSIQDGSNIMREEDIIVKVGQYNPSQNCEGAAIGYLKIVSQIGSKLPKLSYDLLIITLRPLSFMGMEEAVSFQMWVNRLLKTNKEDFDDAQKEWITTIMKDEDFINDVFSEIYDLEERFE